MSDDRDNKKRKHDFMLKHSYDMILHSMQPNFLIDIEKEFQ